MLWVAAAVFAAFLFNKTADAAPPGAVISNQASLEYQGVANQTVSVTSNTVAVAAAVLRSTAAIEFTRVAIGAAGTWQEAVGPSACLEGSAYVTLEDPVLVGGSAIDPASAQQVNQSTAFNLGEPVFVRLTDTDQNLDYQRVEYALVTVSNSVSGDRETVRLSETGVNTGVFAGYVPTSTGAAVSDDCLLQGASQSTLEVLYTDPADGGDSTRSSAQFDPVQRVFESVTGVAISGARIEIVDATTGVPAVVYGNDGVSQFPSTIVSGSTVTDSSGTSYVFGPGQYRFPFVPNGNYRLLVTPPTAYSAPSVAEPASLQSLPGAPYELGPGSFGTSFTKSSGVSFAVDIPLDPRAETLFLQKRTLTTTAAPGDFVRYELTLENSSTTGAANDVAIVDRLPPGVRFVPGSAMRNGSDAPDPQIDADLDVLTFMLATLAAGQRVSISYVVEIISGQPDKELVNQASAQASGGLTSNAASATILLKEDLFRSTGTLIGRVLEGDCSQRSFTEQQGVPNIRLYLEDGSYAVTDAGGRFHFEGLQPGTHVAQIDTFSVPAYFDIVGCSDTPGFAGRADSQFIKMTRGSLLRADFYLRRKPAPEGRIDLELLNKGTDQPDQVSYDLLVNGSGNVAIENINVMVLLPEGVDYAAGTMRVNNERLGEPHTRGRVLSFALPENRGNWTSRLSFVANIEDQAAGELTTRATAKFDSPMQAGQTTPVAETSMVREPAIVENAGYVLDLKFDILSDALSADDKTRLDELVAAWQGVRDINLSVVGHSDSQQISARKQYLFKDNYVLSRARAQAVAEYVSSALGMRPKSVQVAGRGPDEPVADNGTAAGRASNRRVELVLSGLRPSKPSFLEVTKASSGTQVTPTKGAVPGMAAVPVRVDDHSTTQQDEPDIEALQPAIAMLHPVPGFAPSIPATKLYLQHARSQQVAVWINGEPVSSANLDSVVSNKAGTVAVSRFKGVELKDGENVLRAVITDADGTRATSISRTIYFAGMPIRGEIVADQSVLLADGKTRPVLAVRLYDRSGKPARRGIVGGFGVAAPYRSWWDVENDRKNPLVQTATREATYRVGADGIALIELEPTTRTGEVQLQLQFENYREQTLKAWVAPADRDWILVGFAEGTAAYNTLSNNADAAAAAGYQDEYFDDGRVAFFAKGQIKGQYLFTLAYDSARKRSDNLDGFNTQIDPNRYYALYADTAEQRFEAPSQRKLYVKLERKQFYALFGDFETGLVVTDLARYQRRFNGLLSEYRGENFGYTAFAADSAQSFNRDELRGDGTSGLYRLSKTPIIANSDEIRIEVRDRFDSGVVLESRSLSRFLDYNLDPLNGALYFKRPVPSRDLNFNPIYIVAEYESRANGDEDLVAGGRASLRSSNDHVEFGVTHISDHTAGAAADLSGVDVRWQVNGQTLIKAELAESTSIASGAEQSGTAQSVELEHNGERIDVRAFIREVEDDFGLGYQSQADQGVRRLGIETRAKFNERWSVEGAAGWQQRLATADIRNRAEARLRYERKAFAGMVGLTHAEDKFEDGDTRTSDLAEIGVSKRVLDGRLTLRATGSTALNENAESLDYPTRVVLGADYRIVEGIDLVAEYEDARGSDIDATMSRLGVRATPWSRAQIDTSLTNEVTEYGPRLFSNIGIIQGFQLSERWLLDVGIDQTDTLDQPEARPLDPDRELASGSFADDFLAMYTGATYTSDLWSTNARVEYRSTDREERTSLLFGWYRQPTSGHGLSAGLTLFRAVADCNSEMTNADFRFGWAYRPAGSGWSFLNRTDLVYADILSAPRQEKSWRLINNFNANFRFSAAMQLSAQYAAKYVRSDFGGQDFTGYTDLIGVDLRRGIRGRWDAGVNTSIYHAYQSRVIDYGLGVDIGYKLATNIWLTLGYNVLGFHDDDFSRARYTAQGSFLRFSIKADQRTLKDIAGQR